MGFKTNLKGYEMLLETSRVSFPVVKAPVATAPETCTEVLERMAIGARIDINEVARIHRRLLEAQLTPAQALAKRNGRMLATAARKNLAESLSIFRISAAT